jgi:hypothetical protein
MPHPLPPRTASVCTGEPAWRLLETTSREQLAALLARYGDGQDAASAERVADAIALAKVGLSDNRSILFPSQDLITKCLELNPDHA